MTFFRMAEKLRPRTSLSNYVMEVIPMTQSLINQTGLMGNVSFALGISMG